MSSEPSLPIQDVALAWFVRLRDEAATPEDRAAFRVWLDAAPDHAKAYADIERLWGGLDQVSAGQISEPDIDQMPVQGARRANGRCVGEMRRGSVMPQISRRSAIAASVAVIASGYAVTRPALWVDYHSRPGETYTAALEDGSLITLNTATALSVDYTSDARRVRLHRGEAFFQVTQDAARPFTVEAGPGRASVLGTAFGVRRYDRSTQVTLREGRLEVSAPSATGRASIQLSPGQCVVATREGLQPVTAIDMNRSFAWLERRLVFEAAPLAHVIAEVERYRRGEIIIVDEALRTLPVSAAISIADSNEALETLERTLPIRLVRISDLLVLVYPAAAA